MAPGDIRDAFEQFRDELDEHNDRRERLIKVLVQRVIRFIAYHNLQASRDITNISKKTIFLLHRIVQEAQSGDTSSYHDACVRAATQGRQKLRQVHEIYNGLKGELVGDRFWRYERQVSPGLQEYIEALSFAHFLEHGALITFAQVQETLVDAEGVQALEEQEDGREPVKSARLSEVAEQVDTNVPCSQISSHTCLPDFERLTPYIRDLSKKQAVTIQSLEKIEDAAYAVAIRSLEYDLSPDELDHFVSDFLSTYTENASGQDRET
ncbi:hypothetical protein VNI00_001935 [Paramarasmius palmivorus]|uniref:Uncharacterized protein n=1 Tax=Paramarasmius palmivorus TaxID=297713 RepID=A0AAW0E2J1_9AGAR